MITKQQALKLASQDATVKADAIAPDLVRKQENSYQFR